MDGCKSVQRNLIVTEIIGPVSLITQLDKHMENLPDEIILRIIEHLPVGGVPSIRLLYMGQMCLRYRNIVKNKILIQLSMLHGRIYDHLKCVWNDCNSTTQILKY